MYGSFRDRLLTPRVARAAMSPSAIVIAGAGAAVGIVAGLGPFAAVVGVGAWLARVLAAVPRGDRRSTNDPFALSDPWRTYVKSAQQAKARFNRAVAATRSGPLRDRLAEIGSRMDAGVDECWHIAARGNEIDDARRTLEVDTKNARHQLKRLEAGPSDSTVEDTKQALRAQIASDERMAKIAVDAGARLRLLNARLDEAVARAIELSVRGDQDRLAALVDDVDGVVSEMESLRQALQVVDGNSPEWQSPPLEFPADRPRPDARPAEGS
ncbi:MAG: hypothetical protein AB7L13_22470 [Acidimicrobiia bacterium]